MTPQTAFLYASNFGSYLKAGDRGACFYSFHLNDGRPVSEAHRAQCMARCADLMRRMEAANRSRNDDYRRLQALRKFFEETPLYTKAPIAEAGALALRALQNIRGFLDAQTLRLDDPHNDGSGEDSKVADCFDHAALAEIIMGESLSIVGPPAPRPEPAPPAVCITFETNGNSVGQTFASFEAAAEAARDFVMDVRNYAKDRADWRIYVSTPDEEGDF